MTLPAAAARTTRSRRHASRSGTASRSTSRRCSTVSLASPTRGGPSVTCCSRPRHSCGKRRCTCSGPSPRGSWAPRAPRASGCCGALSIRACTTSVHHVTVSRHVTADLLAPAAGGREGRGEQWYAGGREGRGEQWYAFAARLFSDAAGEAGAAASEAAYAGVVAQLVSLLLERRGTECVRARCACAFRVCPVLSTCACMRVCPSRSTCA